MFTCSAQPDPTHGPSTASVRLQSAAQDSPTDHSTQILHCPLKPCVFFIFQLFVIDPYQLTAPELTYSVVHPLVNKYTSIQEGNLSVVFCLLLNRVHFLRDENVTTAPISRSRAELCEILATRILRQLGDDMYRLAVAAATEWPVYNGADPASIAQVKQERDDDPESHVGNAIELAILGKARKFIKSSACQKLISAIWR